MIVGGAALALMYEDRATHDIDVLSTDRAGARQDPVPAGRRTPSVDLISMRFADRHQPLSPRSPVQAHTVVPPAFTFTVIVLGS